MTDTKPNNGSQEPSDPGISARLALILAAVPVILGLFSTLRDLFDWKLPWSPLAGWLLAGLALLVVGFILLSRKPVRAFLGNLVKDWRTWIVFGCALFLALTAIVAWLSLRLGTLNAVLLEQRDDLADSLATAAVQATEISYLKSTVSLSAPSVVTVSPEPTTPVPIGSSATPTPRATPVTSKPTPKSAATNSVEPAATPYPTAGEVPTVVTAAENPIIELSTRLGVKKTVGYVQATTENETLSSILSHLEGELGHPHILFRTGDVVYMFMPLRAFNHAFRENDADYHVIVLADGTQMMGVLSTLVEDSGGEIYDLGTADKVQLVSLPEDDSSAQSGGQQDADQWVVELSADGQLTYTVSNLRFVFRYSKMTMTGTYYSHSAWTRKFYLVDEHELKHLANVGDFDEIRIDTAGDRGPCPVTVRAGDTETVGTILLVSENLDEESSYWFLVADLVDSDAVVALSSGAGQLLTLRRLAGQ